MTVRAVQGKTMVFPEFCKRALHDNKSTDQTLSIKVLIGEWRGSSVHARHPRNLYHSRDRQTVYRRPYGESANQTIKTINVFVRFKMPSLDTGDSSSKSLSDIEL